MSGMRTVRLGSTGISVSVVGLGTWSFGGPMLFNGRAAGWNSSSERELKRALRESTEVGITHFDTADVYGYGRAESLISSMWRYVPRASVVLASKVGWDKRGAEHVYTPVEMRRCLDGSLRRLGTDFLDIYYLHHCDFGPDDRYIQSAGDTMRALKREGKIRAIGLSSWDAARLAACCEVIQPDVVQVYRNVADEQYERSGLARWVARSGCGVVFFSVLRHGLLMGDGPRPAAFEEGDMRGEVEEFADSTLLMGLKRCAASMRARFPDSPSPVLHALVGTVLTDAPTACVLIGMRKSKHIREAAAVGELLPPDVASWVKTQYASALAEARQR